MSDPSKCLTFGGKADAQGEPTSRAESERKTGNRRLSEHAVRLLENWIVAVVTVLSAGVILVTLLAHRDRSGASAPSGQVAIEAGAITR
jgi:hypothetical protein